VFYAFFDFGLNCKRKLTKSPKLPESKSTIRLAKYKCTYFECFMSI